MFIAFLNVVLGSSLLLAGRRLFWLLLGAIGFAVGVETARRFLHGTDLLTLVAAVGLGILFGVLAVFIESIAIGLAGFMGGGYVVLSLLRIIGLQGRAADLTAFVVGGVLGVLLIVVLFDWALISISSLAGAAMVVGGFDLSPGTRAPAYLGLTLLGVIVQGLTLRREAARRRSAGAN
jgi:hypothetical protein